MSGAGTSGIASANAPNSSTTRSTTMRGFSQQQQQSVGGTLSFSSQYGLVDVASLPVVSSSGDQARSPAAPPAGYRPNSVPKGFATPTDRDQDVFATIEKLADLRAKDILSEEEFSAKKAELLSWV